MYLMLTSRGIWNTKLWNSLGLSTEASCHYKDVQKKTDNSHTMFIVYSSYDVVKYNNYANKLTTINYRDTSRHEKKTGKPWQSNYVSCYKLQRAFKDPVCWVVNNGRYSCGIVNLTAMQSLIRAIKKIGPWAWHTRGPPPPLLPLLWESPWWECSAPTGWTLTAVAHSLCMYQHNPQGPVSPVVTLWTPQIPSSPLLGMQQNKWPTKRERQ